MTQTEGESTPQPYEPPQVKLLGAVTDVTLAKPGIFFDMPHSAQGNSVPPALGAPGTVS
jgi:hypothetical protein